MCFRISIPTFHVDSAVSSYEGVIITCFTAPRSAARQRTGGSARDVLVQFEIGGTDGCLHRRGCLEFKL